jgi:hypothetical protein
MCRQVKFPLRGAGRKRFQQQKIRKSSKKVEIRLRAGVH